MAGVLVAFLVRFLDLGIAQDPMLHATPLAGGGVAACRRRRQDHKYGAPVKALNL